MNLLQHHSLKASILWRYAFFMVQLSQLYVTTGKTIALTIWTFVSRVMSLLFNTLSRFVIAFLPRSNHLLISWLQSPSTVILEPKRRKSVTTSTCSPFTCHAVMGLDAMILVFLIFNLKPALSLSCVCMYVCINKCMHVTKFICFILMCAQNPFYSLWAYFYYILVLTDAFP